MEAKFLSRFTPSMMTSEALEATFVQREGLAERIVELIRDSVLTQSKHHTLIIGPRGIGKTHLISIVYHRISKMEDLHNRLLIAWLREEEWGITSFLDLLMRIFRALLAEDYNVKLDKATVSKRVESLYELPETAEHLAETLLKGVIGDKTLLMIVENLDELFKGLDDEGQKKLRAYLQENPFCTILATAQSLFNGVSLQTSPFYGFFRIHHMEGLDFEDAINLLTKIANFEDKPDLVSSIQTPMGRARIRAVHHLAGGNHRVYVIFSQFLTRESINELVEPFMRTLDDLTPYYQSRIAWLSPQQRKIIEFLCDRRSAITVKEIAQRCFITHQTASSQLKTLKEMGYVRSESKGRESYYELHEPLMRLCIEVKKHRDKPIRLFVDFLRLWYSREELQHRLELLQPDRVLEREYLLHTLQATRGEDEDPRVTACLKDLINYIEKGNYMSALQAAEELVVIRSHVNDWFAQGMCLGSVGREEEALASFNKVVALDPNRAAAWYNRGFALNSLRRYDEALASFDKAIELRPNDLQTWIQLGVMLAELERWDEALVSFNKVIELDPDDSLAWGRRAMVLLNLERYDESLVSFDKAIELGEQHSCIFFDRGEVLLALNRWNEGYAALDDSLSRFANDEEHVVNHTAPIIRTLFTNTSDTAMWRTRISMLIELYNKHKVISALGQGLVRSIEALKSPMVSDEAARTWRDVWKEFVGDRAEFQIPLRLLDAAVRYRETQDQRILLELPVEERKVLKELLEPSES